MNKTGAIIAVIALLVIGGGAYALTQSSDEPTTSNTTQNTGASSSSDSDETSATTISYTDSGFSPSTITVKAGVAVTVKNNSSGVLQFNSNPHPDHTDADELNLRSLSPGKSTTFTVTRTGSFGFHNHLDETDTGTLIVE